MAALTIQNIPYNELISTFEWFNNLLAYKLESLSAIVLNLTVRDLHLFLYARAIVNRHGDQLRQYLNTITEELHPDPTALCSPSVFLDRKKQAVDEFIEYYLSDILPTFLVLGYLYHHAHSSYVYPEIIKDVSQFIEATDSNIFNRMKKGFMRFMSSRHVDMKFKNMELMRLINHTGCYNHICKASTRAKYLSVSSQPGIFFQKMMQDQLDKNSSKRKRSAKESSGSDGEGDEELVPRRTNTERIKPKKLKKPMEDRRRDLLPPKKMLLVKDDFPPIEPHNEPFYPDS